MKHSIRISDLDHIGEAARQFLREIGGHRLLAFYGQMGAGKTTFTAELCRELGVEDTVCSPTFTIVNEYLTTSGETIYHFDFYRIKNDAEAMDIGVEDYFYSGNLCIMEWPENIENLLPDESVRIHISVADDLSRLVEWED